MTTIAPSRLNAPQHHRWFYSIASLALLILTVVGFQWFYLEGKAFPGRPLTPPIRTLLIVHGTLMTGWMMLAVVQPLLVGAGRKRLHIKLGTLGVLLAIGMVVTGFKLGVEAARVAPPQMRLFGLEPREFMAVPVVSILVFGVYVALGVRYRRRPEVHRPLMLMASLSVVAAALGRMPQLNAAYANTWWEQAFTAFFMMIVVGAILLIVKCLMTRSFDRWFAAAYAGLIAMSIGISLGSKTQAWDQFAMFLLR